MCSRCPYLRCLLSGYVRNKPVPFFQYFQSPSRKNPLGNYLQHLSETKNSIQCGEIAKAWIKDLSKILYWLCCTYPKDTQLIGIKQMRTHDNHLGDWTQLAVFDRIEVETNKKFNCHPDVLGDEVKVEIEDLTWK